MNQQAEEDLELLFSKAFNEPSLRAEFIERLLNSNIYFPGQTNNPNETEISEVFLEENTPIQVTSWPHEEYGRVIPFFTSLKEMRLALDSNQRFLCMSCKIFMSMARDALLVLNPESEITKSFTPEEIEFLLMGSESQDDQLSYPTGTRILLGQPEDYPEHMIEHLKKYFSSNDSVEAAYLAQTYVETDQFPALVVGVQTNIKLSDDIEQELNKHLSMIIRDTLQPIRTINLMIFHENTSTDTIAGYLLNETEPFYIKPIAKKKGFFARLFS